MGWFVEIIPAKRREYLSIATVSGADGVKGHQQSEPYATPRGRSEFHIRNSTN